MVSAHELLGNPGEPSTRVVKLTPHGGIACIKESVATGNEFRQYLKTHVEDQLIVGNNTSYIDIAHLLGDMLQKDAMIIMAAASIADPNTYKCLSQPEGMPLPTEGNEFSRALVNAFLESNLATMFPGLIRLK